ncbi:zinc-ribbon domain-containing protein [Frigidibacter sp. ROC022]|uniref:zinc-ribbon domain-containing protein n=1 Tax=Frigidibacter sp. ROC022 TaxID=2971796 RepID=UPI00215B1FEC|nr:zinc-ribbon domain-containing protein [Frigidibacter sp. ROC022]MCR8724898.1 zinc-ribbon domain-containing protein [Frigidibacter sp. ROC022]
MRLICPNCGAQYEVDDSLVPELGRDVQCSNCGHAWFQRPAHLDQELADELGTELPEAPSPEPASGSDRLVEDPEASAAPTQADSPSEMAPPPPAGDAGTGPDAGPESEAVDAGDEDGDEPDDTTPAPAAPIMDDTIRGILVEEAARETKARRAESGIETQGDLGLEAAAQEQSGVRERMARLRGLDVDDRAESAAAAVAAATGAGSRRDLLPDIEEINSSLRSAEERDQDAIEIDEPERKRSGFRLGFTLVLLLAAIGIAVYVFADSIARLVPAAEPALTAYVDWADRMRSWIDGVAQDWVKRITA